MDPNECLRELLDKVKEGAAAVDSLPDDFWSSLDEAAAGTGECDLTAMDENGVHWAEHVHEALTAASSIADLFKGLDEWIRKGGFLPTNWQGAQADAERERLRQLRSRLDVAIEQIDQALLDS